MHSAKLGKEIPEADSLFDYVKSRAEEKCLGNEEENLLLQMSQIWGAYVGEPVTRQSLRFAWMEECCGGGKFSSSCSK